MHCKGAGGFNSPRRSVSGDRPDKSVDIDAFLSFFTGPSVIWAQPNERPRQQQDVSCN